MVFRYNGWRLGVSTTTTTVLSILSLTTRPNLILCFPSIPKYLPYTQFSLPEQGLQSSNLFLNPPKFTMVHQLLGGEAKTEVKKLLMSFLHLLRQFAGAQVSEFL